MSSELQEKPSGDCLYSGRRPAHPRWYAVLCFLLLWAVSSLWLVGRYYCLSPMEQMPLSGNVVTTDIYVHHEFPYMDEYGDVSIYSVGTRLAVAGQELTVAQKRLLSEYYDFVNNKNSALKHLTWPKVVKNLLFLGGLLFCFVFILYRIRASFFNHVSQMMLSILLVFLHFGLIVGGYSAWQSLYGTNVLHLMSLTPYCLIPGMAAFLLGDRVSICLALLLTSLTSLFMEGEYQFILFQYSMLCAIVGIMTYRRVKRFRQILYGGCIVILSTVAIDIFMIWRRNLSWAWEDLAVFIEQFKELRVFETHEWTALLTLELPSFWSGILEAAVLNGIVTTVLMACLPRVMERFFDVVSPIKLNILSRLDHPLLERMRKEAPGTYNHCIEVGNIAGDAAEAIDADRVLAKVCGCFHDIGKLCSPQCFAENNFGHESPHVHLTPYESCNRIREHVTYGRELGARAHLPRPILEAIETHHGNDLVSYFYRTACKDAQQRGLPAPKERDFRYKAPLPRRKEAVLIEMADICEAAARGEFRKVDTIDLPFIKRFVDTLVMTKVQNGQFAEAEMTLAEFTRVCEAISHSLLCKYHQRPKYSDVEASDTQTRTETTRVMPFAPTVTQDTGMIQNSLDAESKNDADIQEPSVMDGERGQDRMR